jgi:hypothetical protein
MGEHTRRWDRGVTGWAGQEETKFQVKDGGDQGRSRRASNRTGGERQGEEDRGDAKMGINTGKPHHP